MYGSSMYPPYYNNFSNLGGMGFGRGFFPNQMRSGLFSKLGNSFGRGFNLSSILTNAQKTLNVVNQAIPVIKQMGPMVNNMKTMFKLASAFRDETNNSDKNDKFKNNFRNNYIDNNSNNINDNGLEKKEDFISSNLPLDEYSNLPSFFI